MYRFPTFAIVLICLLCFAAAAGTFAFGAEVDYLKQVKPLLTEKCYSCHGVLKQESNLRLETRELMLRGGDGGEVIIPGDPEHSPLLERIRSEGSDRMPPEEQGAALTDDQTRLLEAWIRQGAVAPPEEIPLAPEQHWAFQPVVSPSVPQNGKATNPIDALLEAKQSQRTLRAQGPAPRTLQIRRLYLDLIGLPPTPQQLSDPRPWDEIVDELLASSHYGERWARHWMDIWRYSDWYGLGDQLRNSQKHLWHWRDWIIDSLNRDKGYDRMILEMLAGDELAPEDPKVLAATGFLARNYYLFNRTTWLDNTIEHTSKAFLGLTINCAKCHDHKYDPITQEDYYRLRAVFEPHQVRLDPIPGVADFEVDGLPRVFDDDVSIATYLHVRGDPKNPDTSREIGPGVPAILDRFAPVIETVELPVTAYAPGVRRHVRQDRVKQAASEVVVAEEELAEAKKKRAEAMAKASETPADDSTQAETFQETADEFDSPDPSRWQVIGDGWKYQNGSLCQTIATRDRQMVRLLQQVPRDFELTCRYTTTGGTTYKSVTFRFDQSDDGQDSNCVYTSAHAPGPKVQVAFERGGQSTYPAEGRRAQQIEVGRPYTLRFAVRDTLVNVWLDGEFMTAYRYPDRRDGFLSLSGFDATVAFDSIQIRMLDPSLALQEASSAGASATDVEKAVQIAEAKLEAARAKLHAVEATWDADFARYCGQDAGESRRLARIAAQRQAESQAATARHRMLADAADSKKVDQAKQELAEAEKKRKSLEDETANPTEFNYESIRASKKALESPADKESDYPPVYSPTSTGRRLALAQWMVARENPLTSRVAVNHVWLRHFGTPLVESVFDFGLRTARPEHADLLDLLAAELVESGWSLKHLHRLMVTSQAYRRTSSTLAADPRCLSEDPGNALLWRMNARRMESQLLRDSVLSLAGQLDTSIGGPSLDHGHQPPRRSLYLKHSPDEQDKFLEMFDNADVLACYRRSESIVPQQALAMANSELSISMSAKIRERLEATMAEPGSEEFIRVVFETLLARPATDEELEACLQFLAELDQLSPEGTADASRSRTRLVHAILNHNDFITIR